MNPPNTLRAISIETHRLANLWPTWASEELLADGYPSSTPGNGTAGISSGNISNPTLNAALSRLPVTATATQARARAADTCELLTALWCGIAARQPIPLKPSTTWQLETASIAARSAGDNWATGWCWVDHEACDNTTVVEIVVSHVSRLSHLMRRVELDMDALVAAARCAEPACEVMAVRTGLCWRHYHEARRSSLTG